MRQTLGRMLILLVVSTAAARAETAKPGQVIPGEPIDAVYFGPGVVEPMSAVLERERTQPSDPESSSSGRGARHGRWVVPSRNATYSPRSGEHYVVNEWGDTRMGIGFPGPVDVECAYFAGQAAEGAWTTGIRVIGFRGGEEVAATDWFTTIEREPALVEIGLRGVDRIEIRSTPRVQGAGWYAMDDLTYTVRSTGAAGPAQTYVLDFEDCDYKQSLTDSDYAGLTWEFGTGDFNAEQGIPSPQTLPVDEEPAPDEEAPVTRGAGTPPVLVSNFQGVIRGDAGSFSYPPDTCGAAGPSHFIITVNRNFAVYLKSTGQRIVNTTLGAFLPGSNGDPRVLYDQYTGRWVVIVSDFSSRVYLAVSTTSDPTGSWFKTFVTVSQGSDASCWPDYPTLGLNAAGIYTASYMVGCGMSIFAIDKAPLIAPTPSLGTVTAYRGLPWEGAIQPVQTYGSEPAEHFVSLFSSNAMRVRRLTGPMTAPTLTELGFVSIPSYNTAADVPALGSATDLDSVDTRLMNAVFRDGSIWTAHTIAVNSRAACRWYEVDVATRTLAQSGTIADSVRHYFFPSIAVNFRGDALLGFSGSSSAQYAGAYFTGRLAVDPPGEMAPVALLRAGSAPQNNLDQYGRNRWGDYSLTTIDPSNDRMFWTIQEYAHATDIWGTHVGHAGYPDCNGNGIDDIEDISAGTSLDCNANLLPDECELAGNDCEGNQIPDDCQIAAGTSLDCDADGVPDECELDCNLNGVNDECDLASGTSYDCHGSGVPDECEIAAGTSLDCTGNGVPDECEDDCNQNRIRDDCDLAAGTSRDCNANGVPDECDIAARASWDCNANGAPDECDLTSGASGDCNANNIPDECDSLVCHSVWAAFEQNPPFAAGAVLDGLDTDGDGVTWTNPALATTVGNGGCPASVGKAVKTVGQTPPLTDTVPLTSEYFRTSGGLLPPDSAAWALSFDVRSEAQLNPRIDWQLTVKDGISGANVVLIHWASTQSNYPGVAAGQRGKVLVRNPANPSAFLTLSPAFSIPANTCYSMKVVLDNDTAGVQLYIDGVLRLTTTRLQFSARRMDYFRLEQVINQQVSGGINRLALDNFVVCQSGIEAAPCGATDCNQNGIWDECDVSSGTSADANANRVPDECDAAVPAATITGAVSRRTCDIPLLPGVISEPRNGGIREVRIALDVPPAGPCPSPAMLEQKQCPAPGAYMPYIGTASVNFSVIGNELVATFQPALENQRTYRISIGPSVSSVAGQFVEVRGLVGDVNSDGQVNASDRSTLVGAWTGGGFTCATDVDMSGVTNAVDRSLVIGAWTGGQNCAP